MSHWAVLLPILVTDALNPVLIGALVYALGTTRPYANASSLLAGHTAAYIAAGVLLALGLDAITDRLRHPHPVDFAIEGVLGVTLVVFGVLSLRSKKGAREPRVASPETFGPGNAFAMGIVANVIGIPFAIPYFAALDQMLKAHAEASRVLFDLFVYNLLYAAPFAALIVLRRIYRTESRVLLTKISDGVERLGAVVFPAMLLLLGAALLADAGHYAWRGTALF